jgi:hypothetical protein
MVDAGSKAALTEKPLPHVRRVQLLTEGFQGKPAAGAELFGFVDGAHTAAPEHSHQPVVAELAG